MAKALSRETRDHVPGLHGSLVRNSLRDANLAFAGACSLMLGRASISQIFRLIDVRQKKIVEFASVDLSILEYAALSYVWGGPQRVTLLKQNLVHLQQDGALGELPRTLADAIVFTAALDLRYLWVDAICIIQDSNEDKAFQIGNMASIYSCSTITIIAASGKDADSGLEGVQRPRTGRQNELRVPAADGDAPISLVTTLCRLADDDSHFLSTAIWSTRGWTFQERELARRVIVFTDQQIYWACEKSYGIEETDMESEMARCIWDQMSEPHSLISDFADGDYLSGNEPGHSVNLLQITRRGILPTREMPLMQYLLSCRVSKPIPVRNSCGSYLARSLMRRYGGMAALRMDQSAGGRN